MRHSKKPNEMSELVEFSPKPLTLRILVHHETFSKGRNQKSCLKLTFVVYRKTPNKTSLLSMNLGRRGQQMSIL